LPAAFAASVTAVHATFVVTGTSARQLFSCPLIAAEEKLGFDRSKSEAGRIDRPPTF